MHFGQPHRVAHFAFETLFTQIAQHLATGMGGYEQIEVFGEAANSRVLPKSEGSRDGVMKLLLLKQEEHFAEQGCLLVGNLRGHG